MRVQVKGALAKLLRGKPSIIYSATRVRDPKAKYNPRFRSRQWDGYHTFYDFGNQTFPAGFIQRINARLRIAKQPMMEVISSTHGLRLTVDPDCLFGKSLRDYQVQAAQTGLRELRCCLSVGTGGGKTEIMAAIIHYLLEAGIAPILIMVPGKTLLLQTAERLEELLGEKVGAFGSGRRARGERVVVGSPDTLIQGVPLKLRKRSVGRKAPPRHDPAIQAFLESQKAMILDECHRAGSNTWYSICMFCPADVRIGMSGTVKTRDALRDALLEGATGPIVKEVKTTELVERGFLAKPTVYFVTDRSIFGPKVNLSSRYLNDEGEYDKSKGLERQTEEHEVAVVTNRNFLVNVVLLMKKLTETGAPPLVLTPHLLQIRYICELAKQSHLRIRKLSGKDSAEHRQEVLNAFRQRQDHALIASKIFDEGVNAPEVSSLILPGGGKSFRQLRQRLGRGLRIKPGANRLLFYDFGFLNNSYEVRHAIRRLKEYDEEGHDVIEVPSLRDYLYSLDAKELLRA